MLEVQVADAFKEPERRRDISSWKQVDISLLNTRQKKRLYRYKSAVVDYFTTDTPLKTIASRYRLSTAFVLHLVEQCLQQHQDGTLHGYHALLSEAKAPSYLSIIRTRSIPIQDETIAAQAISPANEMIVGEKPPLDGHEESIPGEPTIEEAAPVAQTVLQNCIPETPDTLPSPLAASTPAVILPPSKAERSRLRLVHRHGVRRRRARDMQRLKQRKRSYHLLNLAIVSMILFSMLTPLCLGLVAYGVYNSVRGLALDGVNHLLRVNRLLPLSKNDPMAVLDAGKLRSAQGEFRKAEADFVRLQQLADRSDVQYIVEQFSPDYANKLLMARHLITVGLDVSRMGREICNVALIVANTVHGSPLVSGSTKPLITKANIAAIEGTMVHALYYINDIRMHMSQVQVKDLPISDKQKAQLVGVLAQLPKVQAMITQYKDLVGPIAWLLGVGQPRRFLVQTMDSAELRPSGGFTGQYAVLQIQDGRMAPLSLRDVALLDYAGNDVAIGRSAPPQYSNWMNFGNWGLRDSNLSGDYPTTAQMSMQVFEDEGGPHVDGDISFTPTFIAHILDVIGPIHVPPYNETITSKNLEERLHYYQQDYSAIARQQQITKDTSHQARKAFTSLLGKLLLDRLRHLSTKQLLNILKGAIRDIQSRDLELYFTNRVLEQWLVDHGYSGSIDTFTRQDGFAVVQANISISKASQYVHTTEHDDIVLDAQGGATHNLTITLDYQPTGPVYGFDTYADYIRVYIPATARFLSGDGFDTGQCLSGGSKCCTASCEIYNNFFPSDARFCPDGNYNLGDRFFQEPWKIDSLGPPTALTSDLPGRDMWGGLTETPKNCISYITLSWYVPHVVKNGPGQSPYELLVQKQGGYIPTVKITIDTSALKIKGLKPLRASSDLEADKLFALPVASK